MNISDDNVRKALSYVIDPDLKKDLVSLGMIRNLRIDGKKIAFDLQLTTPACPLKESLKKACISSIHENVDEEAEVTVHLTSKVQTSEQLDNKVMPGVKNIIAVASGKGGVGKSTIAANIAVALSKAGAKTGLIDADIYGPSIPMMFGLEEEKPGLEEREGKKWILPIEKHGIKVLSIGFFVDSDKALLWRGPMASNALNQLFTEAEWGDLDYLVVDLPPGTGDIHLTLVQTLSVSGVVIVSTPQNVALADAKKGVSMFMQSAVNVPVLGMIENMAYFTPEELPDKKYYIFGKEGLKKLSKEMNVPFLGEIPIVQNLRESGDNGIPAALNDQSIEGKAFMLLAQNIAQQLSIRNATMEPTKKVNINEK